MWQDRLCVPRDEKILQEIMTEAHNTSYAFHPGSTKMYQDLKCSYWWPGIKKDVAEYVSRCLTCQHVKALRQRQVGLLQPLYIPHWKWEEISMDFITGLPKTRRGFNVIWVIVDRLTKAAHFIPDRATYQLDHWAQLYVKEIVRLHGVPVTIVSNRDVKFTSNF